MLSLIWAALALSSAALLFTQNKIRTNFVGGVALTGVLFSLPILISSAWPFAFAILIGASFVLFWLWNPEWNQQLAPILIIGLLSLVIGSIYTITHAGLIHNSFIAPQGVTGVERRVVEAERVNSYLTNFYFFFFMMMLAAGTAFAWPQIRKESNGGNIPSWVGLIAALILGGYMIDQTNLNAIQADMTYKRGRPYDVQATQTGRQLDSQNLTEEQREQLFAGATNSWENATAIYQRAIDMMPTEDYYYLWIGRAYLEHSAINQPERNNLLGTAEERLLEAQRINPLNTDHTANLARLNARWASYQARVDADDSKERATKSAQYYQDALALSPQNSVIRNELGGLKQSVDRDCEAAISTYSDSLEIDPFFDQTYLRLAIAYRECGSKPDAVNLDYLEKSYETLQQGREELPDRVAVNANENLVGQMVLLAQVYYNVGEYDLARETAQTSRGLTDSDQLIGQIDMLLARIDEASN